MTYSVHLPPLIDLFCTYRTFWLTIFHIDHPTLNYSFYVPSILDIFFILVTLYVLFCKFIPPWWACSCIFYGYICTYFWWPILYTYLFLVTYFIYKDILMSYSIYSSRSFFFTVVTFMASFVYLLLGEFMFTSVIFYGYLCMSLSMATCTYPWWPILYTCLVLVIYSVYKELFGCIIFKHTT